MFFSRIKESFEQITDEDFAFDDDEEEENEGAQARNNQSVTMQHELMKEILVHKNVAICLRKSMSQLQSTEGDVFKAVFELVNSPSNTVKVMDLPIDVQEKFNELDKIANNPILVMATATKILLESAMPVFQNQRQTISRSVNIMETVIERCR